MGNRGLQDLEDIIFYNTERKLRTEENWVFTIYYSFNLKVMCHILSIAGYDSSTQTLKGHLPKSSPLPDDEGY